MSRFRVQPGQEDRVHEAFRQRPHRVDNQPGFVRMEVMRPEERPNEFWLITVWRDRASFERWHRHHMADSHQAMPPGLTLEPGSQALEYLELVSE